jgi:L-glyceraldehyde 3-phosphate reductase
MGLDYVDIYYHHRPDPETPLEETMGALNQIVRQGKALYIGISSYSVEDTLKAIYILNQLGTPLLIHQPRYSLLDRWIENGLTEVLMNEGVGCITFSSLEQGILTDKYLYGIPDDSRAATNRGNGALDVTGITDDTLQKVRLLNEIAGNRGQTLAQMALAWVLRLRSTTSVIIGASRPQQVLNSVGCLKNLQFSKDELEIIEQAVKSSS